MVYFRSIPLTVLSTLLFLSPFLNNFTGIPEHKCEGGHYTFVDWIDLGKKVTVNSIMN